MQGDGVMHVSQGDGGTDDKERWVLQSAGLEYICTMYMYPYKVCLAALKSYKLRSSRISDLIDVLNDLTKCIDYHLWTF